MKTILSVLLFLTLIGCSQNTNQTTVIPEDRGHWIEEKANSSLNNWIENNDEVTRNLSEEDWRKLRWVSKTLVFLRGGNGLDPTDDINPYLKKSKRQIVEELIRGPEFYASVLKFNFFLLGSQLEDVYTPDGTSFSFSSLSFSPAFNSALEVSRGGDYFRLLGYEQKFPLAQSNLAQAFLPDGSTLTGLQAIEHLRDTKLKKADDIIQKVKDMKGVISMPDYCAFYSFDFDLFRLGLPFDFNLYSSQEEQAFIGCNFQDPAKPTEQLTEAQIIRRWEQYKTHVQRITDLAEQRMDLKVGTNPDNVDMADIKYYFPGETNHFFRGLAGVLTNSSTNLNRKRAAYILDRMLCDNLLPLDVEVPDEHQGDAHGTQASCYACHYRLDPMAGFFKDQGLRFRNFSSSKDITFDDFATVNRAEYQKAWLNPAGSKRKWNIGVIRSEKDEAKNFYGESLEDLFSILKKMPEVKKCIAKRAFEFSTSPGQNVDQGYLNEVTTNFSKIAETNSTKAIQYLFKTYALNNTFTKIDPETKQCYDYSTGHNPDGAPPCQVNFILENKCSKCHYPLGGENGLDLTTWKKMKGDLYGFVHEPNGSQLSLKESFTRIKDSLISTDPKKRMPYKQHMDPSDRETLFLWVNEQLTGVTQ